MKVYSILLFSCAGPQPVLLTASYELSSFSYFQRGSVKEVASFVSREVLTRTAPGGRNSVAHLEHICHAYVSPQKFAGAVISDSEYPARVAYSLIAKALEEFSRVYSANAESYTADTNLSLEKLEPLLISYQKPTEVDSVSKIQKDLDETKDILVKSIDQLLARGEKLDTLLDKSSDLSFQSKAFMKNSEKLNSCCIIL
eukprot:TRINITY_DN26705_c0_g1_i1.p1 TRINITY_DN26705_c0_g1~~TRINITY_DN26705_c0_g1_i1.p1  ORF type:complete len:199 (+),score=15.32 TRINITY_DN26705_c0_g1_i1:127-723(+)